MSLTGLDCACLSRSLVTQTISCASSSVSMIQLFQAFLRSVKTVNAFRIEGWKLGEMDSLMFCYF